MFAPPLQDTTNLQHQQLSGGFIQTSVATKDSVQLNTNNSTTEKNIHPSVTAKNIPPVTAKNILPSTKNIHREEHTTLRWSLADWFVGFTVEVF
jgi:hypothetical protein